MKFLVSVEARYIVVAENEDQALAAALAAANACGIEAPGICDRVECRGADLICCTEEEE